MIFIVFLLCCRHHDYSIRWASYKNKSNVRETKGESLETSPVHVSFISYQVFPSYCEVILPFSCIGFLEYNDCALCFQIDRLVTEESLRALFSKYGYVVDASIKKSMIDKVGAPTCIMF